MSIIAWIVLGAIAGYLAGFLVKGDEGLGIIGHIVLGIVGALVGGFLAGVLFNTNPIDGPFDISSIVVSVIGAVIVVLVVGAVHRSLPRGSRPRLTQTARAHRPDPSQHAKRPTAPGGPFRIPSKSRSSTHVRDHRSHRRRRPGPRRLRPVDPVRSVPAVHGGRREGRAARRHDARWTAKIAGVKKTWTRQDHRAEARPSASPGHRSRARRTPAS